MAHSAESGKNPVTDLEYDLFTTMSSLLQGADVLDKYVQDAEQAGDREVATLFGSIRDQNHQTALQVRAALKRILNA